MMNEIAEVRPIAVYIIEHHPLESSQDDAGFHWLELDDKYRPQLAELIGPYNPDEVSLLKDQQPGGAQWERLLAALMKGMVEMVITHLAPLSMAQRQQLIAICAQSGAQLITPSDAGRNREGEELIQ